MRGYSGKLPALSTLIFFKVNVPATRGTQRRAPGENREVGQDGQYRRETNREPGPEIQLRAF